MFSLTFFGVTFTFSWRMFLCAFVAILILMGLGHWQVMRAHEKKALLLQAQQKAAYSPVFWQGAVLPEHYQSLRVQGTYLPQVFLLDNQHHAHQFGYDVLSALVLNNGAVVLVDRGWLKSDATRQVLPPVFIPKGSQKITGYAYYPSHKQWVLGTAIEPKTNQITVIEIIDTKLISKILHKSVYPFIIRLHSTEANGYVRQWPLVSMSPSRHIAYAIQWYAMAAIVLGLFIGLNVKKAR